MADRKLGIIVRREYLERVRSKWFVIVTAFGPLFFLAIIMLPSVLARRSNASADVTNVRILDATATDVGRRIAARLAGPDADTTRVEVVSVAPADLAAVREAAVAAVNDRRLQGVMVVDSSTFAGERTLYIGRNSGASADVDLLTTALREGVLAYRLEAAGLDAPAAREIAQRRYRIDAQRPTAPGRERGDAMVNLLFGASVTMLLYISIILYGVAVLRGVQEEKQTRVAEVVLSSVPANTLLAGKVLGVGAVGLTQIAIWVAAAPLLFRFRAPLLGAIGVENATSLPLPSIGVGAALTLVAFFILGYLLYSSLFAAVGAMVSSEHEAQQAAQPIIMVLVAAMIFLQAVIAAPSGLTAKIVSWIPFTAPVIMPLRMSLTSVPPLELALVLLGMAITCWLCIRVAARIYRTGLLMYGKRPSLRELARWARSA